MHTTITSIQINKALHFKKWSRKAYASFISISRVVVINHLSANITERLLQKATSPNIASNHCMLSLLKDEVDYESSCIEELPVIKLLKKLFISDLDICSDCNNNVYI